MTHRMASIVFLVVVLMNGQAAAQGNAPGNPNAAAPPSSTGVNGSGTPGTVPLWTGSGRTLTDSRIKDDGSTVTVQSPVQVSGAVVVSGQVSAGDGSGDTAVLAGGGGVGIGGQGTTIGVQGLGATGVYGSGSSGPGVIGNSSTGDGVVGTTSASAGSGVSGHNTATSGFANGVFGQSAGAGAGVAGLATGNGTGISGFNNSGTGGIGVFGDATTSTSNFAFGVLGLAHGGAGIALQGVAPVEAVVGINSDCGSSGCTPTAGTAGVFATLVGGTILHGFQANAQNNWTSVFRVDAAGKGFFNGGTQVGGADFAESMQVSGDVNHYERGDVLIIDSRAGRRLDKSREAYATTVAGIYSTKPGVLATPHSDGDARLNSEVPLAVVGIVPCKVTAANGSITPGDLLVTSSLPGYAMKGTNRSQMLDAMRQGVGRSC